MSDTPTMKTPGCTAAAMNKVQKMKVLVSGSGPRAEGLREYLGRELPSLFPQIEFISTSEIPDHSQWTPNAYEILREVDLGIFLLSSRNLTSGRMNFEAGAVSLRIEDSRLFTLLTDDTLDVGDLGPFTNFQATRVGTAEQAEHFLRSFNRALGDSSVTAEHLNSKIEKWISGFIGSWKGIRLEATRVRAEYEKGLTGKLDSVQSRLELIGQHAELLYKQTAAAVSKVNERHGLTISVPEISRGPSIIGKTIFLGRTVILPDGSERRMSSLPGGGRFNTWDAVSHVFGNTIGAEIKAGAEKRAEREAKKAQPDREQNL
jgi:hypothetical protein